MYIILRELQNYSLSVLLTEPKRNFYTTKAQNKSLESYLYSRKCIALTGY